MSVENLIAVIDYGMGNVQSVCNAFEAIGAKIVLTSDPEVLADAQGIVLPGVGAFEKGIANLRAKGLVEVLNYEIKKKGKPFFGICLGLQLITRKSFENGEHEGLGWIEGVVRRLDIPTDHPDFRLPHIGWNDVRFVNREGISRTMKESECFYFVHSYVLSPNNPEIVSGWSEFGEKFVACIELDNVCATQFHPEKSHHVGLKLLKNWCAIVARC